MAPFLQACELLDSIKAANAMAGVLPFMRHNIFLLQLPFAT